MRCMVKGPGGIACGKEMWEAEPGVWRHKGGHSFGNAAPVVELPPEPETVEEVASLKAAEVVEAQTPGWPAWLPGAVLGGLALLVQVAEALL